MSSTTPVAILPEHLAQYHAEGYTLLRNLIPAGLIAPVRDQLVLIEEGRDDWPGDGFQYIDPCHHRCPNGRKMPIGLQLPARHSPAFAAIADHPRLQETMAQLLGGQVERLTDQALIKSRHIRTSQAGRTYYHQDSHYWRAAPRLGCNAWIALDPVGQDAIALAIMPGSQRDWTLHRHESYFDDPTWHYEGSEPIPRWRIPHADVDFSREVVVTMQPGDALFFSNFTWHRSEPNLSGRSLAAYAIAYRLVQQP